MASAEGTAHADTYCCVAHTFFTYRRSKGMAASWEWTESEFESVWIAAD